MNFSRFSVSFSYHTSNKIKQINSIPSEKKTNKNKKQNEIKPFALHRKTLSEKLLGRQNGVEGHDSGGGAQEAA